VKARVEAKIADIEERLRDLERIRTALLSMSGKCVGIGPIGQCPVPEELYK
jgi:hypothetical protein